MNIVLTKVTIPVIGWVSSILGWIINVIYAVLSTIGLPNIGLAIILFTLVIYLLMDTSADQTAEVFQAEQRNAARDSENSEEI